MSAPPKFADLFPATRIAILDGGFGTTLEHVFHKDISNPLWSAALIVDDPETVIQAHLAFLKAGAQVILTSTYQASTSTFARAGHAETQAEDLMAKAVQLANEARSRFHKGRNSSEPPVYIALSLGPFGATLTTPQEFGGYYPPPYGPREYQVGADNCNAFESADAGSTAQSIDALANFHLDRLRTYSNRLSVWKSLDCIAFETVPLAREVTAIRKAMRMLCDEGTPRKPWWLSLVVPDGRYPQTASPGGEHLSITQVVSAILSGEGDIPSAIGVNCTETQYLPHVVREIGAAVRAHVDRAKDLWLVVYPNRRQSYNAATRTWTADASDVENIGDEGSWARTVAEMARRFNEEPWKGVIVGGCCQTGPQDIRCLAASLR